MDCASCDLLALSTMPFNLAPVISVAGSLGTTFSRIPFKQESSRIPPMRGAYWDLKKISISFGALLQQQQHWNLPALFSHHSLIHHQPPPPGHRQLWWHPQQVLAGSASFLISDSTPPSSFCAPQLPAVLKAPNSPLLEWSRLAHASCARLSGGEGQFQDALSSCKTSPACGEDARICFTVWSASGQMFWWAQRWVLVSFITATL